MNLHVGQRSDRMIGDLEERREQADEVSRQHEIQNLPATVGQRLEADGPAVLHDVGVVVGFAVAHELRAGGRSEEHTSELQSLMRISYAVFCLKKKNIYL